MAAIEHQSAGMFKAADFRPPGCENAWCSFHADYLTLPGGNGPPSAGRPNRCRAAARRSRPRKARCAPWRTFPGSGRAPNSGAAGPDPPTAGDPGCVSDSPSGGPMRLDDFLDRARSHTFTVSAMAFQDAWTMDLERLRDCCIHVLDPRRGLVPFCAYNVTAVDGRGLVPAMNALRITPLDRWIRSRIGLEPGDCFTREDVRRHQLGKLRESLSYASRHSPFYRRAVFRMRRCFHGGFSGVCVSALYNGGRSRARPARIPLRLPVGRGAGGYDPVVRHHRIIRSGFFSTRRTWN